MSASLASPPTHWEGEVVHLFAFDIAYELTRPLPATLLGQPLAEFGMDVSRRQPRHLLFYKPLLLRLPPRERVGPQGPVRLDLTVKILPIGALSIAASIGVAGVTLEELRRAHEPVFASGSLAGEMRELAEQITRELGAGALRPVLPVEEAEGYTVFCLRPPAIARWDARAWLEQERGAVAALLTQEPAERLSAEEVAESTSRALNYFTDDLCVVDWDAALLLDDPADTPAALYILELANLQLAELKAYDRLLDAVLERSYRDVASDRAQRGRRAVLREVRELQIDLTRFHDELSNATKFFGDWHLARLFEILAARFHLAQWHQTVERKLHTLGELHQILRSDRQMQFMILLEVSVVVLIVLEVVLALRGGH
ncbi:MAG: hypothetical protein JSR82_14630 [Verrucomicrobia bacterium]|nr:hypothetical protein [Verrucomicrobiota bacterium]